MKRLHPNYDIHAAGCMPGNVGTDSCDLFLAFLPLELLPGRVQCWLDHAQQNGLPGLTNLSKPVFFEITCALDSRGIDGTLQGGRVFH